MQLEIDEQLITENVTLEDLAQVDLTKTVSIQADPECFIQLFVDEEDGNKEIYFCDGQAGAKFCECPSDWDSAKIIEIMKSFMAGNHSWTEELTWEPVPVPGDPGVITEQWEFYPCRFEDDTISMVVYNHGVSDAIDMLEEVQFAQFKLSFKSPDENGQPSEDEEVATAEIEDAIEAFVEENDGLYVGRMTHEGYRHFYTYVGSPVETLEAFADELVQKYTYPISVTVEDDPDKVRFWNDLFPNENDWQLILDSKVVGGLAEAGDSLETPRSIEHWAQFETSAGLESFATWISGKGFEVMQRIEPQDESEPFGVQFCRTDIPDIFEINQVTVELRQKCHELDGEYDGWESEIVAEAV